MFIRSAWVVLTTMILGCQASTEKASAQHERSGGECVDVSLSSLPVAKESLIAEIAAITRIPPEQIRTYRVCRTDAEHLIAVYREGERSKFGAIALLKLDSANRLVLIPSM